ncbi:aldehyde ferredoxin oxidoreductase C-terminal domain-containing protein [Chloroflexota bacterium]
MCTDDTVRKTLDEYYEFRDWDRETGIPSQRNLEQLDLKDVADELDCVQPFSADDALRHSSVAS